MVDVNKELKLLLGGGPVVGAGGRGPVWGGGGWIMVVVN